MKKPTGRRSSGNVIHMAPKDRHDRRASSHGTVMIDRVFDHRLGRFEEDDAFQIEGNFDFAPEEEADPPGRDRPDAVTAVVGSAFETATTPDLRRRLRHNQALCAIVHVPSPAWVTPVSLHFRSAFGDRWLQHTRHGPTQGDRGFSTNSASVSLALSGGQSVVGIAADLTLLPRALIGAADITIRLPPPNGTMLKTAIARFTKRAPGKLEDCIAADLDLPDLVAAFRPGAGPVRIAQRLAAAAAALRVHADLSKRGTTCSS